MIHDKNKIGRKQLNDLKVVCAGFYTHTEGNSIHGISLPVLVSLLYVNMSRPFEHGFILGQIVKKIEKAKELGGFAMSSLLQDAWSELELRYYSDVVVLSKKIKI